MVTYYLTGTNSDLSGGADFSKVLSQTIGGSGTVACSIAKGATETSYGFTDPNDPSNAHWETGGFTVKVTSTTGNQYIWISIRIDHIDSAGNLIESSAQTAEQNINPAGTYTFNVASKDWTAGNVGDRIRVAYIIRNSRTQSAQSITLATGNANTTVLDSILTRWTQTPITSGLLYTVQSSDQFTKGLQYVVPSVYSATKNLQYSIRVDEVGTEIWRSKDSGDFLCAATVGYTDSAYQDDGPFTGGVYHYKVSQFYTIDQTPTYILWSNVADVTYAGGGTFSFQKNILYCVSATKPLTKALEYSIRTTRSTNLLSLNQATGTEDGSSTGFAGVGATVSSSTEQAWQGTRSVKVVTNNASSYEGVRGSS